MQPRNTTLRRLRIGAAPSFTLEDATDLSALKDRRVLVLLDEQNLSIGAERFGYDLRYDLLAERIQSVAHTSELHLFTAAKQTRVQLARQFQRLGYLVHVKDIRHIRLPNGRLRTDSNVDNLFSFWAGLLAPEAADTILLGSGDYGLAGELAAAIRQRRESLTVMTLSLPGSTAQDLDARLNPSIAANLEIGLDLLRPVFQ